jgi:hypothetical protein
VAAAVPTATRTPTAIPTAVPTTAPSAQPSPEATESAVAKRPLSNMFALAGLGLVFSLPLVARRKRG